MAKVYDDGVKPISFTTTEDLSEKQYRFVELAGSASLNKVNLCDSGSTTYGPIGILQNEPASGVEATVQVMGFSKLYCAAPGTRILFGHWLTSNASGQGVVTTTASLAHAIAMENGDSASACYVTVLLNPFSWLTRKI